MAASYYPVDEGDEVERVATSVRLPKSQHEDIKLIADLWNGLDEALGKSRPRSWKTASVIERLVEVGIDGFWAQVGGRPDTKEGREEFIKRAVAQLTHSRQKQKK